MLILAATVPMSPLLFWRGYLGTTVPFALWPLDSLTFWEEAARKLEQNWGGGCWRKDGPVGRTSVSTNRGPFPGIAAEAERIRMRKGRPASGQSRGATRHLLRSQQWVESRLRLFRLRGADPLQFNKLHAGERIPCSSPNFMPFAETGECNGLVRKSMAGASLPYHLHPLGP